jgi:hypothetical protein
MKPERQSVIQHVLALLVVLAMPQIAFADDPCKESDDAVLKFVSSLPRLSSEDLRLGKFNVKGAGAEFLIAYLIKGKQRFQRRISKDKDIFGELSNPPSPEISHINVEGYNALFIKHVFGAGGGKQCNYIVVPSPPANRFLVIPDGGVYYQKHRGWSELLYRPYVNGKGRVEGLDGLRNAQDIDCDGEAELITHEIQNWYLDCDFNTAEFPVYKRIYHLSPERHELYEASSQFPQVYVDLGDWLRKNQNFRVSTSTEKSPRCEGEVQRLINEATKMASAGTGSLTSCTGDQNGTSAAPPIPYEDSGACPFECCTYRRWIATKNTTILRDRERYSPTLFNVKKGEWISALTGVVITTMPGEAKVLRPITINGIRANIGDIVYLLTYQGEGVYEAWYKGKKWEPEMSSLEIMRKPESTWWVQIKNNKGQEGWSREPENFDNKAL